MNFSRRFLPGQLNPTIEQAQVLSKENVERTGKTPWLAISSIILMFACVSISCALVISSNGSALHGWKIQPPVLLAILSAVLNAAAAVALAAGTAVSWWIAASKGTTVKHLLWIADYGGWASLRGPRANPFSIAQWEVNKVLIAALIIAITALVDNPLLQRSIRVENRVFTTSVEMKMAMAQRIPDGWPGTIELRTADDVFPSANTVGLQSGERFRNASQSWYRNISLPTMQGTGYTCDGTCEAVVTGAGVNVDCDSTMQIVDMKDSALNGTFQVFLTDDIVSRNATWPPFLTVTLTRAISTDTECVATMQKTNCTLRAALVEYPILIQSSAVSLDHSRLNPRSIPTVAFLDSPADSNFKQNAPAGPLLAVHSLLNFFQNAKVTLFTIPTQNASAAVQGPFGMAWIFRTVGLGALGYHKENLDDSLCQVEYLDQTDDVLHAVHDFMFRTAVIAGTRFTQLLESPANQSDINIQIAQSTNSSREFTALRRNSDLVFVASFETLGIAAGVVTLAAFALIFLLWGWWTLDRYRTLNPLEMAIAFGAPILNGKTNMDEILTDIGDTEVQYKEVPTNKGNRLLIAPRSGYST